MLKSMVVCLNYSQHRPFFSLWMHCIGSALNKDNSILNDYVTEVLLQIPSMLSPEPRAFITDAGFRPNFPRSPLTCCKAPHKLRILINLLGFCIVQIQPRRVMRSSSSLRLPF